MLCVVQIIVGGSQPSLWTWLGPTLLLCASLLASGVALYGVKRSNATNRAAIFAADQRERSAWRRDTLLKAATDAMSAAITAHQQYRRALDLPEHTSAGADWLDRVTDAGQIITSASTTLQIMGATESASECLYLRNAVMDDELLQLVAANTRRQQPHRERFNELANYIDTRATVFAQIVTKEIGEPQQRLPVLPGRP